MAETTILCLLEPVSIGAGNNNKKNSKTATVVIEVQKSNGGNKTIMLHGAQRTGFQYGDRIVCRKGVLTLTFNPDRRTLSHSVALGYVGHLKTEMVVSNETVSARTQSGPALKVYTLAGWNKSASGTNR